MTTTETRRRAGAKTEDYAGPAARGGSWRTVAIMVGAVFAICLFWRSYQQMFAFKNGLESHQPGFNTYWLTLAAANMTVLPATAAAIYGWLWVSAKRLPTEISRADESRRLWALWGLIAAFCAAVFLGGSYFAEQDASWHQIVTRDTAFTPSHDVLFYGVFPLMIYMAVGIYLYARTRLPHLYGGTRLPVSFTLMTAGSFLLLFQVAMNEFGHSFFQGEELFAAPLHWPFVLFAYLLAATFAVWFETLPRIFELARQERELAAESAAGVSATVTASVIAGGRRDRDAVAQT
ncbi:methane monooxygenase/ammonia monooxygenase subunit C [Candidatus Mycolicibacterium alkanivorans]|uniref:Ammonia monooxygenase n=1 Tax=Candidatus Mycolicibacterium alkanivorans TaxID=2954114 RepID=A0ABS9YRP8_9MYCO|nr:methane monooxygenase/ammonia monooxygenase subunit C [Candidatus Mycolicibacterium alkanivorans]MCI4673918.1 ammonia monooxygenase [Candidatus Mycolicibacterium alkanivorans]